MAGHHQVPVQSLLWPLVEVLQKVSCLADLHGRNLVVRTVSDELGYQLQVVEYPQATAHLLSIVTACRDCAGGLTALLDVLEHLEQGATAVVAARQIIVRMLSGLPPAAGLGSAHGQILQAGHAIPRRAEDHQDPASLPCVWGGIPLRSPDFVGREGLLERLRTRLVEPGATAVLPEALYGLGGVGKSQTVAEYIYRHAGEYDVIWWIPAAHVSQVTNSFVELARRLGLPAESAEVAVRMVLDSLRRKQPPLRRWLLVFDNAESPAVVTPFFPPSGHVVVTSRNPQWATVAHTVEVEVFTRQESIELLRRRDRDISELEADRLAEALGDLPLAVEHAAAWRLQTGMPVGEYLHLLDRRLPELFAAQPATGGGSAGHRRPAEAIWGVSLRRLSDENPAASQLLQLSVFFGPEPILKRLLAEVHGAPMPAALAGALRDPIELNRAIGELSRYSLAKVDPRSNTIQVHRLVQSVVWSDLTEEQRADLNHCVHLLLARGDPGAPSSPRTWPHYAELLVYATNADMSHCRRPDPPVRRFLVNLARYLISCGDFVSAHEFTTRTSDAWREHFGETDADTLAMSRRCGVAKRRLGRFREAQMLNEHIHDLVVRTYGEDNELFLEIADARRADERALGLFADELRSQHDILQRSRRMLGDDHPSTLKYAHNLASCLRLNGQFGLARQLDEDTLARKRVVLGDDHPSVFQSANALAIDLRECGRWRVACELLQETIARQCAAMGDEHPATVGAMRNLAVAKRLLGDYADARRLSESCVRTYRRRQGDRHVDTITARLGLSADLRRLGDLANSSKISRLSHRLFVESHGENHPYTLVSANNLGITLRLIGEVREAHDLDSDTVTRLRLVFSEDHPFTLVSATNLASDLAELGEFDTAADLGTGVLRRSSATIGADHPSTLAAAANLAADLAELGRAEDAATLRDNALIALRAAVGEEHPMTSAVLRSVRINCEADTLQL